METRVLENETIKLNLKLRIPPGIISLLPYQVIYTLILSSFGINLCKNK